MKSRSILIGAYELKRHYQMHMAIGFAISSMMILAIFIAAIMLYFPEPNIIACGPGIPYNEKIGILPPQFYIPEKPVSTKINKPTIGIPVPGPEINTSIEALIPTNEDLAGLAPQTPITELGGGIYIDTQKIIDQAFPAVDSFFPVDEQPVQVTMVQPKYPELARKCGIECKVIVKVLIDKDGTVKKAIAQNPVENDLGFEAAAIEAALQCTYRPAINNGMPIAVWVTYVVAFRLK
jgi:TonB family protein